MRPAYMMEDFLHSRYGHDPNGVWNILQHLACNTTNVKTCMILHARLCLPVARRQSNKMPSYIVEIIQNFYIT